MASAEHPGDPSPLLQLSQRMNEMDLDPQEPDRAAAGQYQQLPCTIYSHQLTTPRYNVPLFELVDHQSADMEPHFTHASSYIPSEIQGLHNQFLGSANGDEEDNTPPPLTICGPHITFNNIQVQASNIRLGSNRPRSPRRTFANLATHGLNAHPRFNIYWNKEESAITFDLPSRQPQSTQERVNQYSANLSGQPNTNLAPVEKQPVESQDPANQYAWGEPATNQDLLAILRDINANHPALKHPANKAIIAHLKQNPDVPVTPRALRWYYNVRQSSTDEDVNTGSDFHLLALVQERKRIRKIAVKKEKALRDSAVDENGMNKKERKLAKQAARRAINDATVGADGLSVSQRKRKDRLARKEVRNSVVGEDGLTRRQRLQELRIERRRRKGLVRGGKKGT